MALEESRALNPNRERRWRRFLSGPILLIGLAFLIWQDRSLARQLADLEASIKRVDYRVESSAERLRAVSALQPSLMINPGLADEIAERVLAQLSVPATAAEPKRPIDAEVEGAPPSASEDDANRIVDAAIRSGKLRQEDVLSIRALLAKAGAPEAFGRVGMRIAAAINRNEIQPESPEFMLP